MSGDSFAGGKLATAHLLRIGRKRIAFLGGPAGELEVADRFGGYEEALQEAGQRSTRRSSPTVTTRRGPGTAR